MQNDPPLISEMEMIACDNIEATAATQVRVRLDKAVIDTYTDDLANGADMPPIVVFREENSDRNIMADGFQRHRAAINNGWEQIGCKVYQGKMIDALIYALGANAMHGARRTNLDKRHAVEMAIKDPEIGMLRASEIADICRVTKRTVEKIINEHLSKDENDSQNANGSQATPKDPEPDDFRDDGTTPTQADVELGEVRQVCAMIKVLPYDGADAAEKLEFNKGDIADLEYVSTWCANAVIAHRNGEADG